MLTDVLQSVESGALPPPDGKTEVVPAPSPQISAVVCFTGHAYIAADLDEPWVRERVPDGDLSAVLNPPFLYALERRLARRVNCVDLAALARSLDGPPPIALEEVVDVDHPRVRRARRYRHEIRVWTTPGGVLVLGRGLGDC